MIDYKNGKIYQIVCNITGERYVGSTTYSLEDRLRFHKYSCNPCCSKQIIERGDYYIELLETYPCNNEFELRRKEGEYQITMECINKRIAGRTQKEWREDNKEIQDNKRKQYRIKNDEKIKAYRSQVVVCECGCKVNKDGLAKHKLTKKHIDFINNIDYTLGKSICECGCVITSNHIARHKLTKKHIDLMNKLTLPSNDLLVEEKVLLC